MPLRQLTKYILGLAILATSSLALSNTEFTYNEIDGGIEVTGCVGTCPTDLVIPDSIDGYTVTSIGSGAFYYKELTSLIIGNSVTKIGADAFSYNHLTTVTIPDSVITIDDAAFNGNGLNTISIGNSVTTIGKQAFNGPKNQLTSLTIPVSVTSIKDFAFTRNQLTNVTFLGSRHEISGAAFDGNNALATIHYCYGATGWPGQPIEGITSTLDVNCDSDND